MSTVINFATGVPRITNKGLLVEEARTNLLNYSQEFDNAYWTKANATVTANAVAAPDGTLTADKLAETTFLGAHAVQKTGVTVTTAASYVVSIHAKAAERSQIQIQYFDGTTNKFPVFSLIDGSKVTDNGIGSAWSATQLSDGWWRFDIIVTSASTSAGVYFYPAVGGTNSYQGVTGSGIYVWGAQLEAGAFATSYIPTTSASATRGVESPAITSLVALPALTLYAEFEALQATAPANQFICALSDGTTSNRISLFRTNGGTNLASRLAVGGVDTSPAQIVAGMGLGVHRVAIAVEAGRGRACAKGILSDLKAPTAAGAYNKLSIGMNEAGSGDLLNGYVRRVQIIPRALTDAELQALTT